MRALATVIYLLTVPVAPLLAQPSGRSSGIEDVRIGMSHQQVEAILFKRQLNKFTGGDGQEAWSFSDGTGVNTISFVGGKVAAIDVHTTSYKGDSLDLVRKLFYLLYPNTKPSNGQGQRAAAMTLVLEEYPSNTGDEPVRRIEFRFGDKHVDLTLMDSESLSAHLAMLGEGVGNLPRK